MKPRVPWSKRILDILLSLIGLILLSPLLLLLIVLVRLKLGRPVFFNQPRTGLSGKIFNIHKFRTMTAACDQQGNLLADAERLTKFGHFLRATSMDELPELWNVLVGEMSMVGPRPLLPRYILRYSQEQYRRHNVLPGITGWAQVNGRNAQTWEQRFEFDISYVDNWSFYLDIRILLLTFVKVIRREGISQPGQATMPEFMGRDTPAE